MKKQLSMKKLYMLASNFLIDFNEGAEIGNKQNQQVTEAGYGWIIAYLDYIWKHKNDM